MHKRVDGLDIVKGFALLLMVTYHFTYDLNHFHLIHVNIDNGSPFLISRYLIMSLFILSVGMSLALAHTPTIHWRSLKKRVLILGGASTLVTLATSMVFPNSWIYFGILHFILVASFLALPFLPYPKVSLITATLILLASATKILSMQPLFELLQPIFNLPYYTEDLISLVPWFALVLLGMAMVQYQLYLKLFALPLFSEKFALNKALKFMGQHSLLIYLVHQPLLFGGFMLFLKS